MYSDGGGEPARSRPAYNGKDHKEPKLIRLSARLPRLALTRATLIPRLDISGLVLIEAPPGAGKTTLVSQWSAARPDRSGVWVGASRTESRARFWGVLHLLLTARESVEPAGAFSREGLIRWLGPLGEQTIVIRDAHRITDPEILEDIVRVVRACANIRFIVFGRDLGALLARADGAGIERELLTRQDLLLGEDETAGYFRLLGYAEPERAAAASGSRLDGTFGTLHAVAHGNPAHPLVTPSGGLLNGGDTVFDWYLDRVRAELATDASYTRFLALGLPDEIPADLISAVTEGDFDATARISGLLNVGVFGPDARDADAAGRYPLILGPRLRARMVTELREAYPTQHAGAARRIIRWKMRNGYPAEALARAVAIGDLELATEVVWRNFGPLMSRHGSVVARSLRRIPLGEIRHFPMLCMTLALVYNSSGLTRLRGTEYFGLALAAVRDRLVTAPVHERALLLSMQSVANRVIGRFGPAVAAAKLAEDAIIALPLDARETLGPVLPVLGAHLAITLHYAGNSVHALEILGAALAATDSSIPEDRVHVLALIAGISAARGDFSKTREALARLDQIGPLVAQNRLYLTTLEATARATLALEQGDPDRAVAFLETYREELETSEHWPAALSILTLADLMRGMRVGAITRLESRLNDERRPPIHPLVRSRLTILRADLELFGGDLARADRLAAQLISSDPETVLYRARRELAAGQVRDCAVRVSELSLDALSPRWQVLSKLLLAAATVDDDDPRLSLDALEAALAILAETGVTLALLAVPYEQLVRLEARARSEGRVALADALTVRLGSLPNVWESAPEHVHLTTRERLVLRHLAHGLTAPEIARALTVSPNTVKTQSRSVYRKLGVSTRGDAIMRAARLGLIGDPTP